MSETGMASDGARPEGPVRAAGASRVHELHTGDADLVRVGLGCAWSYGEQMPSEDDVRELLDECLRLGVTMLDTADSYGPHLSEQLLGEALVGRRDRFLLATKGGYPSDPATGRFHADGRPEFLVRSCEESLQRLRTDRIDIYYLHRPDPAVPIEESWGALAGLVAAGKVRAIGVCEVDERTLGRLEAIHPVAAVQSELSVWTREALADVVPWCARTGAAFVAFAPLGRGYFAGPDVQRGQFAEKDLRRSLPRFSEDSLTANRYIPETLAEIGARHGVTGPQVALRWVLSQGPHIFAVPGTRRVRYLRENRLAADLVLDDAAGRVLDDLRPPAGERY